MDQQWYPVCCWRWWHRGVPCFIRNGESSVVTSFCGIISAGVLSASHPPVLPEGLQSLTPQVPLDCAGDPQVNSLGLYVRSASFK